MSKRSRTAEWCMEGERRAVVTWIGWVCVNVPANGKIMPDNIGREDGPMTNNDNKRRQRKTLSKDHIGRPYSYNGS